MNTRHYTRIDLALYDNRGQRMRLDLRDKQMLPKDIIVQITEWLLTQAMPEEWITPEKVEVKQNPTETTKV